MYNSDKKEGLIQLKTQEDAISTQEQGELETIPVLSSNKAYSLQEAYTVTGGMGKILNILKNLGRL